MSTFAYDLNEYFMDSLEVSKFMMGREKIYNIIEKSDGKNILSTIFDWIIMSFVILSVSSIIVESFEISNATTRKILSIVEHASITVFTVEYLLRVITVDFRYPGKSFGRAFVKFFFSPMAVIDLLAILPFYMPRFTTLDLRFLRAVRLLRIFKFSRYNNSLTVVAQVFVRKKNELLITTFTTFVLLLISSVLMYYVEAKAQPDAFPNILASLWWGIITLTTVGYGDVYPVTVLGKFIGGIISFLGIGIVALPTGILSSGFMEIITAEKDAKKAKFCSNCGEKVG